MTTIEFAISRCIFRQCWLRQIMQLLQIKINQCIVITYRPLYKPHSRCNSLHVRTTLITSLSARYCHSNFTPFTICTSGQMHSICSLLVSYTMSTDKNINRLQKVNEFCNVTCCNPSKSTLNSTFSNGFLILCMQLL